VRALLGGHDVRRQRAGLEQPAQRAVHRGVADLVEPRLAQPADDVVAVAVVLPEHGEHGEVEHALQQLTRLHRPLLYFT
jgi:hypothetical protein